MKGDSINWSGGYIIYVGIDIAKKKFDYCVIDSKLRIIKRGILITNSSGFSEFLKIIKNYRNIKIGMELYCPIIISFIYCMNLYFFILPPFYFYMPLLV